MILHAKVHKRNASRMKSAVIGLVRPVVDAAGERLRLVMAEEQPELRPPGDFCERRSAGGPVIGSGGKQLTLVAATHHIKIDIERESLPRHRGVGNKVLGPLQPELLRVE